MSAAGASDPTPFWRVDLSSVESELGTDGQGLTESEAARRLAQNGLNALRPRRGRSPLLQFLARFSNPLVLLLLAAAILSAFTGERVSATIIAVMIALSVTLDFVQEYRAGRAAERLKGSVALRANVTRDGAWAEIHADRLVPGDRVRLEPGDLVPADGRVLEARSLYVSQALLTGEAFPVEKLPGEAPSSATDLVSASNAVWMGSSVVSGTADILVCRTGRNTALAGIGESLGRQPPPTAFETGIRRFGFLILRLAIGMVLFVLLANTVLHRPWLESFLFAVALAVGLTPELLPMVVSITLARGALRMAKERVIVKHLPAIHDLGSMDVLCTDKTGTLTEAKIRLKKHLDPSGKDSDRLLQLAYLNSSLQVGRPNPLDQAILEQRQAEAAGWRALDEVPFDFQRRCVSVLAERQGERVLVMKGAFEDVLQRSARYEGDGPEDLRPIDEAAKGELRSRFEALSREGYRVLGVAWRRPASDSVRAILTDEAELVFAGFAVFEDPPKPTAASAVLALAESGVAVKIVTGDNELVTQHVCAELGLPVTGLVTGEEIEHMTDPALAARAESVNLFCRVTPPQKNRVILALRARGHVVGYLGDGINDAPPIHSADVGISVDGAADVAKEAADLILLDHDLGVVHRGVLEGRRTLGNVVKYVLMGTSSNFGNMFSMAGGTLLLPFLPMRPVQILVNNFLYDLSEIPIPTDRVDPEFLERPRRWDLASIRNFMLVVGPISSIFDFLTFYVLRHVFRAGEALFQSGWFVESLATQVLVIFVIRTRGNPFRSRPSSLLVAAALAVVTVATALPYTPLGARIGFVPVPGLFFVLLAGIVVAYLAIVEVTKRWFYRRFVPLAKHTTPAAGSTGLAPGPAPGLR